MMDTAEQIPDVRRVFSPYVSPASTLILSPETDVGRLPPAKLPATAPLLNAVSLSTTFFPSAPLIPEQPTRPQDLIIHTSDNVFFYVHKAVITSRSSNDFNWLVMPSQPASLTSSSTSPALSSSHSLPPSSSRSASTLLATSQDSTDSSAHSPPRAGSLPSAPSPGVGFLEDFHFNPVSGSASADETKRQEPTVVAIPEPSPVLNLALHVLYNLSCAKFQPDLSTIAGLLAFLVKYGYSVHQLIGSQSEVSKLLLVHAQTQPFQVFALAASHALDDLCVMTSRYTLGTPLWTITDTQAAMMGPVYLKRLFLLHMNRAEQLKRLLGEAPEYHPPTITCDLTAQKSVTRAWSLATAFLINASSMMDGAMGGLGEPFQNISSDTLNNVLGGLVVSAGCPECKHVLRKRVDDLIRAWSTIKCTI